jgi:peptide/nickel transport system substrate-binding protein
MSDLQRRAGMFRRRRNDIENHIVDEYVAGRIDRREFIRRGTVAGLSLPMISFLIAACGGANDSNSTSSAAAGSGASSAAATGATKTGGTIRLGITTPSTEVDPVLNGDTGGLAMLAMTGEFLCVDENKQLTPWLAESWTSNADASEWTFKIRQGVNFNDGTPMTAKDVAASINRLSDPANKSNALSAFTGVLSKDSATAPDDATVVFKLDAPNGSFPYYLSSDNYNAIILPAAYAGNFTKTFPGTGPWKMASYTEGASASFVRNDGYWGKKAIPDKLDITFASDEAAQILALQGGQLDVVQQVSVSGAQAILDDPKYNIITLQSSAHRQLSMRCDQKPFDDPRVRQAIALSIDRKAIVDGLFQGKSDLGNDSPFAPVFAQTDTSVPQRSQDVDKAKQLVADAGATGASTELVANQTQEIPEYAQIVVDAAKAIGINIKLKVEDSNTYYGEAVYGKSHWLDSVMSLVDYGHRGVPNVFLSAPLLSDGTWNAAHYKDPAYDKMVGDYIAAVDLQSQQKLAGGIQKKLLDDTPIIFAYFYNFLSPTIAGVTGVRTTAMSHVWVDQAALPA